MWAEHTLPYVMWTVAGCVKQQQAVWWIPQTGLGVYNSVIGLESHSSDTVGL